VGKWKDSVVRKFTEVFLRTLLALQGRASKKSTPFSGALEHWILGHVFLIGGHVACGRKMYTPYDIACIAVLQGWILGNSPQAHDQALGRRHHETINAWIILA